MKSLTINFTNATGANAFHVDNVLDVPKSFLYRTLSVKDGACLHSLDSKPFSLSQIRGRHVIDAESGRMEVYRPSVTLRSVDDAFIDKVESCLRHGAKLSDGVFVKGWRVEDGYCARAVRGQYPNSIAKTASPICLRVHHKTHAPFHIGYWDILTERTRNRLRATGMFGEDEITGFSVGPDRLYPMKSTLVTFKGKRFLCGYGVCRLYGTPSVRRAAAHIGIGGSCGCGFGAIDIVS